MKLDVRRMSTLELMENEKECMLYGLLAVPRLSLPPIHKIPEYF